MEPSIQKLGGVGRQRGLADGIAAVPRDPAQHELALDVKSFSHELSAGGG
jgi:hypothetical protein